MFATTTTVLLGILFFATHQHPVRAHLAAVCSATHEQRPGTVTFLYGTYHSSPYAGSSVPGTAYIKTPQGQTHDFDFDSFCSIPSPEWALDNDMPYYRARLLEACVCEKILGCGAYSSSTGMCTGGSASDCATIDPKATAIQCYGQDYDIPSSAGAWGRQLKDNEDGNCAYGTEAGVDFAIPARTFYTATVDSIYSGIFEVWSTETDINLEIGRAHV